jgi:hypothetical protein
MTFLDTLAVKPLDNLVRPGIVEVEIGMAQAHNVSMNPVARRRSQRVLMQVAVRIRGEDVLGKNIEEETETLAINAHGALVLMKARVTSGSKVLLQHKRTEEEQECHVAFLGPVRSGKAEIGLEFSSPRPAFWRVAFPPEDWTPRSPEARTFANQRRDKP